MQTSVHTSILGLIKSLVLKKIRVHLVVEV